MGACTVSNLTNSVINSERVVTADLVPSASYATGGETVPIDKLGLKQISSVYVWGGSLALSTQSPTSRAANPHGVQLILAGTLSAPKLKAYKGSASEVSSTTDLSATPAIRVEFRGV